MTRTLHSDIRLRLLLVLLVSAVLAPAAAQAYIIGEEDMLQISVWGNSDLSVHVPVRPDGMISIPLVGDERAAGKTPQELKISLEKDLARFMKAPVVSVLVTAVNSFKVYIFGEGVSRNSVPGGNAPPSGQFTLKRDTTLLQMLAQIGSLDSVQLHDAFISRDGKRLAVDFIRLYAKGDLSQDVRLEPNDIIYLPGGITTRIRVIGEVKTPGLVPFAEGMTALDAVLSAGGFTEYASRNGVVIVRKEDDVVRNIKVPLKDVMNGKITKNIQLKPGDIVSVKSSFF